MLRRRKVLRMLLRWCNGHGRSCLCKGNVTLHLNEERLVLRDRVLHLPKRCFYMRTHGQWYKGKTLDSSASYVQVKFPTPAVNSPKSETLPLPRKRRARVRIADCVLDSGDHRACHHSDTRPTRKHQQLIRTAEEHRIERPL